MGKTALATNIAYNAAYTYQHSEGREGAVVGWPQGLRGDWSLVSLRVDAARDSGAFAAIQEANQGIAGKRDALVVEDRIRIARQQLGPKHRMIGERPRANGGLDRARHAVRPFRRYSAQTASNVASAG